MKLYKQTVLARIKANEYNFNQNKNKGGMLKGLDIKRPIELEFEECCHHHDASHDHSHEDDECEGHHDHSHEEGECEGHHDHEEKADSDASENFFTEESSLSSDSSDLDSVDDNVDIPDESKISKTLGDNTTRAVIVLVLALLAV